MTFLFQLWAANLSYDKSSSLLIEKTALSAETQSVWYVIMISTEANMILIMNESSLISDKIITSLESQSIWYVIIINAEANMILMIKVSRKKFKFIIIIHTLLVKKNKK